MSLGTVLRTTLTCHRGLLWFTTFEGDRFFLSVDALPTIITTAKEILAFPVIPTPKPVYFGAFCHRTIVQSELSINLYSLSRESVALPIKADWLQLMAPLFGRAHEKIGRDPTAAFTLDYVPGGSPVESAPDLNTLPPTAH